MLSHSHTHSSLLNHTHTNTHTYHMWTHTTHTRSRARTHTDRPLTYAPVSIHAILLMCDVLCCVCGLHCLSCVAQARAVKMSVSPSHTCCMAAHRFVGQMMVVAFMMISMMLVMTMTMTMPVVLVDAGRAAVPPPFTLDHASITATSPLECFWRRSGVYHIPLVTSLDSANKYVFGAMNVTIECHHDNIPFVILPNFTIEANGVEVVNAPCHTTPFTYTAPLPARRSPKPTHVTLAIPSPCGVMHGYHLALTRLGSAGRFTPLTQPLHCQGKPNQLVAPDIATEFDDRDTCTPSSSGCSSPPTIDNTHGVVNTSACTSLPYPVIAGTTCKTSCKEDSAFTSTLTCQANGTWAGQSCNHTTHSHAGVAWLIGVQT